jgi:hypothetical protein
MMLTTSEPLHSIALSCGMCDQPHFTRSFRRKSRRDSINVAPSSARVAQSRLTPGSRKPFLARYNLSPTRQCGIGLGSRDINRPQTTFQRGGYWAPVAGSLGGAFCHG